MTTETQNEFATLSECTLSFQEHMRSLIVTPPPGKFVGLSTGKLIAAAPELLEACKYFEEILEHALSEAEKLALPNSVVNIGSLMRAAIGKATGQ